MDRHQCWGCCFIVSAIILIVVASFTPKLMDNVITSQAREKAQLTEANLDLWAGIPGKYDLSLDWIHYFYNCTNYEDVLYKGAAPKFMELGPYTYREYDSYDNLTWTDNNNW